MSERVRDAAAPPATVQGSFWLWIAFLTITAVGGLISLFDPASTQRIGVGPLTVAVVFAVAVLALTVVAALSMRRGRNWGRVLLTALGVLVVISAIVDLTGGADAASAILDVLEVVIIAAALLLAYRRSSNAYFAARAPHTNDNGGLGA